MKSIFVVFIATAVISIVAQVTTASLENEDTIVTGICGKSLQWTLDTDTGVMRISGEGEMRDQCNVSYPGQVKGIIIEDGVTSIISSSFCFWPNLSTVLISKTVRTIGDGAFDGSRQLTRIDVDKDNKVFSSIDGVLFDKEGKTLFNFPDGKEGDYVVPEGVETIREYAFSYTPGVTGVKFSDSLVSIGQHVFEECIELKTVTFGKSFKNIGDDAFNRCTRLTSFFVDEANPYFKSVDGVLFDKNQSTLTRFPCGKGISYTIPDSVETIGHHAFQCYNFQHINFGKNVKYLGNYSFSGTSLTSVVLPDSVESIGTYAFSYCTNLQTLVLPESVTTIEENVFLYCTVLKNVTFGGSIKTIKADAFHACQNLAQLSIPDSVETVESSAFQGCIKLDSLHVGKKLSTIGEAAFNGCYRLYNITVDVENKQFESVDGVLVDKIAKKIVRYPLARKTNYTVPSSIKAIGPYAFSECEYLGSIVIGESVSSIGKFAFYRSKKLKSVAYLGLKDPGELSPSPFYGCFSLTSVCVPRKYSSHVFCGLLQLSDLSKCGIHYSESSSSLSSVLVPCTSLMVFIAMIFSILF